MSDGVSANERLREELDKFCNEKLFPNLLREIGAQVRSDLSEEFQRFRMELQYSVGRTAIDIRHTNGDDCEAKEPDESDQKTSLHLRLPNSKNDLVYAVRKDEFAGLSCSPGRGMSKASNEQRISIGDAMATSETVMVKTIPTCQETSAPVAPTFSERSLRSTPSKADETTILKKREQRLDRLVRSQSMEEVCFENKEEHDQDIFGRYMMGNVVAKEIDLGKEDDELNGHPAHLRCACYVAYRERAMSIISHSYFDYFVSSVIVANAVVIGVQTDIAATERGAPQRVEMRGLDLFFCFVFTCELAVRLSVYHVRFFCSSAWRWNCFDFLVVSIQLVEEALAYFMAGDGGDGGTGFDFSFMRILRVLRMIRIIRLVRIMRMIGELRMLVASISNSLRSLLWTIFLLFLCIYIVGVYFTAMLADHPNGDGEDVQVVWGSLFTSMLTLFECITGGMDWHDALSPMMEHVSPLMALPFVLYVCFAILAMMNVITGVFVESALSSAKEDQEVFMVNNVRDMLKQEGDQVMTWQMFVRILDKPEMIDYFKSIDVDISEARGLFMLLDLNDSGTLDTEEFLNGCIRLRGIAKSLDLALLAKQVKQMNEKILELGGTLDHRMGLLYATQKRADRMGLAHHPSPEMLSPHDQTPWDKPPRKHKAQGKINDANWMPPAPGIAFAPAPPNDFYPPKLNVVTVPDTPAVTPGYLHYDEC
jgi:voltage-gated sodium channel